MLPTAPLIVVEGTSDRSALLPFLAETAEVVPAAGKDQVLCAFEELEQPHRAQTAFVVDCDGGLDQRYKGSRELIITSNRDLEADLLFELNALRRLALDVFASRVSNARRADSDARRALETTSRVALSLGLVHTSAISLALPTKIPDQRSGRRRTLRVRNLAGLDGRLRHDPNPSPSDMAALVRPLVGWSISEEAAIVSQAEGLAQAVCEQHGKRDCLECLRRIYCRGHHLVDALALVLDVRYGIVLRPAEVERALRLAVDGTRVEAWEVFRRLRCWGTGAGVSVVA